MVKGTVHLAVAVFNEFSITVGYIKTEKVDKIFTGINILHTVVLVFFTDRDIKSLHRKTGISEKVYVLDHQRP